ncbi:tetratricopeptide repeat protein (macronuclear) [Tetrahymena thermophila SB210]|uniref:Tetratricopeptide repeat protein n=1 Tax=Tetrahymena thermophila (strain SB210) TaxID=312017 RepID=Q22M69_TETTS|nr:tetratricopeptide repeat protein [Tetrahymena thermophila SB210]EAR86423.1 tetratricopeptide repeat protein [Tetrahymena thermophila SB210]|eukprot:XP_977151.1 tetratricopeptide repeat protein [Tetrahymena thermophila SB210]
MELIIKQLEIHKQITVTKSYIDKPDQQYTVIAHDSQNQYSIKVISLHQNQDEQISQQRLDYAQQLAHSLKSCNHENIAKYFGEFQIEENYFILLERFEMNLIDWQLKNKLKKQIDRKIFIQFSLQLLHALEHIHSKNYVLQELALRNIFLDKDYNIKLCDFGFPQEVIPSEISKQFMDQRVDNISFYLPPELFDFSKNKIAKQSKVLQEKEGDVWVACVCLYALAEATLVFIKRLTKGTGFYVFQEKIDKDINKVLMNSFWLNKNLRPKISDLILSFEELQKVQVSQIIDEYEQEFIDKYNKGKELYSNEQFEESIEVLKEAIQINPSSYQSLNLIGNNYFENNKYNEAINYFTQSINVFPENPIAYKSIGHSYLNLKQYETAIENLNKAVMYNPEYSHAYNLLGVCYHNIGDTQNAAESYIKANSLCPQQCIPLFNLGNIYLKKKVDEESKNWYEKAIETNPNYIDAYTNLGVVNCNQSQFEQALIHFEKASQIDPLSASINHNIWFACMKLQRYDYAINYFKNRLKINGSQQTNYYLALTLIQQDNLKNLHKSIHYLKQQIKLEPQLIEPFYLLVDSFFEQEKQSEIIKYSKISKSLDQLLLERIRETKSEI